MVGENFDFAPLKCLEMLPNRTDMWQFSVLLTDNKEVRKNNLKKIVPRTLFLPQMSDCLTHSTPLAFCQNIYP